MHEDSRQLDMRRPTHRRTTSRPRRAVGSLVLALVIAGAAMSAMYGAGRLAMHVAGPDDPPTLTTVTHASWLSGASDVVLPDHPPGRSPARRAGDEAAGHWARVLRDLDNRRADAWRLGRSGRLTAVYVPGSAALARDRAMLDAYTGRGFRVAGAKLCFIRVALIDREGGSVRLRTVDQLRLATARLDNGRALALPRDRPTRHEIVLERWGREWRIASVRSV
ncbi:MAG: hypothetical protein ABJA81_13345 [Nocardioidaceae bacterium]